VTATRNRATATSNPTSLGPTSRKRGRLIIYTAAALAGVIAAGLIWFLGGTEPAAVDLGATVSAVTQATTGSSLADLSTSGDFTDVDGNWAVVNTIGTFNFEEATATFAGFRVEEELASIGVTTAVGRSPEVTGNIEIVGTTVTEATFEVDLTAIVSNEERRNDAIQEALNTGVNPSANFELGEAVELGSIPAEGTTLRFDATGALTINGVTQQVTIPLGAQVLDGNILVVGSLEVVFADYGIEAPSAPIVVSVEDHGTLELQLWLIRD
jgi:polyisoprenoid-binding protein YceI